MNNRFELADLKAAAHGRWPEIHAALGVPTEYLNTRKHQPCPYCGGRDRYRYTDHKGNGGFICNQCTPDGGSGFDLLMLVLGYEFKQAAHDVAVLLGMATPDRMPPENPPPRRPLPPTVSRKPPKDKQAALLQLWRESLPLSAGDPVSLYLQARGLPPDTWQTTGNIRYAPAAPFYALRANDSHTAAPLLIGHYPAMIAAISNPQGELQGLHTTYLQADGGQWRKLSLKHPETGEPLPAKKMRARLPDSLRGAGVYLGKADNKGRLIVAEGIETALAARLMFGLPAIATLSANGMRRFQWRPNVKALFIVADNDLNQVGQAAAHELARRAVSDGLAANVWQSEQTGFDCLDEYNSRKGRP